MLATVPQVSIGAGCTLAEIQQSSDITYRIYDYKRPGLDGKPRPLHTELARDAIDYTVYPDYRTRYEPRRDAPVQLAACPYFTTDLYDLSGSLDIPVPGPFLVLIGLSGGGTVRTACGEASLRGGEAILVSAADGPAVSLIPGADGLRLLTTRP